jgi:hypothetical protein
MRSQAVTLLDHGAMRGWDEILSSACIRPKNDILATPDELALTPTNSLVS